MRPQPALPPPGRPAADVAAEIEEEAKFREFTEHLLNNRAHYERALRLGSTRERRASELASLQVGGGASLLEKVENRPIEVLGDYVAYPCTDEAWKSTIESLINPPPALSAYHKPPVADELDERLVTLPTRGVFAEAKLGHCNASEEIDNTRFWDWQTSPIPHFAPEIAPTVPVTPQPQQQNLSPTPFPSPIVNIVNPPNAPDPTGLAAALNVLATPNIFRDMSGRAEVADLLKKLSDNSISIAEAATAARSIQAKSAAGGSLSGGSGGMGTGGGGFGGPRAMANQPSAVNRDLQDFSKWLGREVAEGRMPPATAQSLSTEAAQNVVGKAGANTSVDPRNLGASEIKISFSGSFQCRLATDPAPTDMKRPRPNKNEGWTFTYGEDDFNRVINFQSPVQLRSALIDPFVPVKVTAVEVKPHSFVRGFEIPYQRITDSVLLGAPVSLGVAKFLTRKERGPSFEDIIDCTLSVGKFFSATPTRDPQLEGIVWDTAAEAEYLAKKNTAIAAADATGAIVLPRKEVLSAEGVVADYAKKFSATEQIFPATVDLQFTADTPLEIFKLGWSWALNLTFSRFDGDTLTGRVVGTLTGTPPMGEA